MASTASICPRRRAACGKRYKLRRGTPGPRARRHKHIAVRREELLSITSRSTQEKPSARKVDRCKSGFDAVKAFRPGNQNANSGHRLLGGRVGRSYFPKSET